MTFYVMRPCPCWMRNVYGREFYVVSIPGGTWQVMGTAAQCLTWMRRQAP